jgi:hypothetical protein
VEIVVSARSKYHDDISARRESHHTGMSFTGCTGGAQMRNYSKSILNASSPEVVLPPKLFSSLILMNNLFISSLN